MIKGAFFAVTEVFADFFEKINKFYHTFKRSFFRVNNPNLSKSYLDLSAANSPSIQDKVSIFLKQKVFSGSSTNWLAPKVKDDCNVCGRSMIEMLGVLAIIGVLSVGGIAGYSKAMEKFKVNKAVSEYSYLIQGLLEHLHQLKYLSHDDTQIKVHDYIQAANLVPTTWKITNGQIVDAYGNTTFVFSKNNNLVINLYLGGRTTSDKNELVTLSFSDKLCIELFQNLGQPLHKAVNLVRTSKWGHGDKVVFFYGDDYCGGNKKCLKDISFAEMKEACGICDNSNSWCNFTLEF